MLDVLKKISKLLAEFEAQNLTAGYCVIGGVALSIWGTPRTTMDIDFLVNIEVPKRKEFVDALNSLGMHAVLTDSDIMDPVPCIIRAEYNRIPIDFICVSKTWELEAVKNAMSIHIEEIPIDFVDVSRLIILKLKAGGPQDLLDVVNIIESNSDLDLENLQEIAETYKVSKKLSQLLRPSSVSRRPQKIR